MLMSMTHEQKQQASHYMQHARASAAASQARREDVEI